MAEPGQFELRQPALAWSRIRSALSAAGSRVGVIVLLLTAFLLRIAVAEFMLTNNSNDRNMFFDAELYQAYATKIYREQSFMLGDFGARRTLGIRSSSPGVGSSADWQTNVLSSIHNAFSQPSRAG